MKQKEKSEVERIQAEDADAFIKNYAWMMNDKRGRAIVQNIIDSCACDLPNYEVSAYVEGRRSVGLEIRNWIKENLTEQYLLMERERVETIARRVSLFAAARRLDAEDNKNLKLEDAL